MFPKIQDNDISGRLLDDNEKLANDSNDSLHEVLDDLNKFNDELKKPSNDSFSTELSNLPYPPGYSIIKQNDSMINCENQYKEMTKKFLKQHCAKNKLYQTPQLNDILYLHYNDLLPNFTKLIISHNKLTEINDLIHLIKCEQLSVLDIQYNFIKDPNVVDEVFAKLPNLRVLYNQGNPFIREVKNYRKNIINQCRVLYNQGNPFIREVKNYRLSNKRQVIEATRRKTELSKQAEEAGLSTDDIQVTPGDVDWLYGNIDSAKNESDSGQELEETNNDVETYTVSSSNARDEELDPMTDSEPLNTQTSEEFYSSEMVNLKADNTELNSSLKKNDEELIFDDNTVMSEQKNNSNEDEVIKVNENNNNSIFSHLNNDNNVSDHNGMNRSNLLSFLNITVKVNENNNNSIFSHLNNDNNVSDHNGMNRSNLLSFLNITGNCNDVEVSDQEIENDCTESNELDQLDETIVLSDETAKENPSHIPKAKENPSHIPKSAFIEELCNEAYNPNNTFCMNTALDKQENFIHFDKTNDQNVIEIYEEQDNTNES
ncbi:uncharacterized protein DC041_0008436 [Schistosoma bovis]|uniref:Uncharacterized protein n=1 Tax=Schistosoma bovis TaxID=6184 RepID=A0A430Q7D2_SCHBO|nr:uncharacterized protein DC041_0008436 [Schistosoma bovis]